MQSFMTVSANTQNYYFFPEKQSIRRRKTKLFSPTAPPMLHFLLFSDKFSRLFSYRYTVNFSRRFRAVLRKFFVLFSCCFSICSLPAFTPTFPPATPPNFRSHFLQISPHCIARFLSAPTWFSLRLLRPLRLFFATSTNTPDCASDGLRSACRRNFFALRRFPPEFLHRCPINCLAVVNNDTDNQINTNLYINDYL